MLLARKFIAIHFISNANAAGMFQCMLRLVSSNIRAWNQQSWCMLSCTFFSDVVRMLSSLFLGMEYLHVGPDRWEHSRAWVCRPCAEYQYTSMYRWLITVRKQILEQWAWYQHLEKERKHSSTLIEQLCCSSTSWKQITCVERSCNIFPGFILNLNLSKLWESLHPIRQNEYLWAHKFSN